MVIGDPIPFHAFNVIGREHLFLVLTAEVEMNRFRERLVEFLSSPARREAARQLDNLRPVGTGFRIVVNDHFEFH